MGCRCQVYISSLCLQSEAAEESWQGHLETAVHTWLAEPCHLLPIVTWRGKPLCASHELARCCCVNQCMSYSFSLEHTRHSIVDPGLLLLGRKYRSGQLWVLWLIVGVAQHTLILSINLLLGFGVARGALDSSAGLCAVLELHVEHSCLQLLQ